MSCYARDIHAHLQQAGPWVDWESTCDGFKAGDGDSRVTGIAVAWQSTMAAIREAQALGCNLFITHEPTFYSHFDDDPQWLSSQPAMRKRAFLERTGMVVYRCHDLWDRFPGRGILDAWSAFLALGEPLSRCTFHSLHAVPSTTAWELAHRIARQVAPLGEQAVQFVGPKWKMVRRLAVGTGAITRVREMVALGADCLLTTDDGISYWREGGWAQDSSLPMIVVNHMSAEIPGLRQLAEYLAEQFPELPVSFVGPTCSYEILATETSRDTAVRMRRDTLDNLPAIALPPGYTLRPMATDESGAYLQVMNRSNFAGEGDEAWFHKTFSSDPAYDPSYLQLIWKGEQPVAAAAAWHSTIEGQTWGMIHWVGVDLEERGQGLGKVVVLAALHRLRGRGLARAMLGTHTWRLPAIAAYLRLGFAPWPGDGASREAAPQAAWDQVMRDLEEWRRG